MDLIFVTKEVRHLSLKPGEKEGGRVQSKKFGFQNSESNYAANFEFKDNSAIWD